MSETTKRLTEVMDQLIDEHLISINSTILYVDDGSFDRTWELIEQLSKEIPYVKGLKLSKNVGHQNALLAGLHSASVHADCAISIDADLQDDVTVIKSFIEKFNEGYDVVYGVRSERKKDTFFKRTTAQSFYRLLKIMGVQVVYNHADYRLLSRRVLSHLKDFKEANLFLRGIIPLIGFKSAKVFYERNERFAGESKYPLKKMLSFAFDGITSFSIAPVRLITSTGFALLGLSLIMVVYSMLEKLLGHTISGWTSIMLSIWLIGCFQLISIGLIGEYIGKIFVEVKGRPNYIIEIDHYTNPEEVKQDESEILSV